MSEAKHTVALSEFPGYEVSRDGEIVSVATNWRGHGERSLAQTPNDDGYPSVRLTVNGKRRHVAVHKLVAAAFLPPAAIKRGFAKSTSPYFIRNRQEASQ